MGLMHTESYIAQESAYCQPMRKEVLSKLAKQCINIYRPVPSIYIVSHMPKLRTFNENKIYTIYISMKVSHFHILQYQNELKVESYYS